MRNIDVSETGISSTFKSKKLTHFHANMQNWQNCHKLLSYFKLIHLTLNQSQTKANDYGICPPIRLIMLVQINKIGGII